MSEYLEVADYEGKLVGFMIGVVLGLNESSR